VSSFYYRAVVPYMLFPRSDFSAVVKRNQEEYATIYDALRWVTPDEAHRAADIRADILKEAHHGMSWLYHDTKPFVRDISPGCRMCGSGTWSCLFINGMCNGRCFYCPTEQRSSDVPTTSSIQFKDPRDYVDYLSKFDFKGVSISGGEPFLTFDRTLRFITAVKRRFGDAIYLWLYTNGIKVTREKLLQLRDAGVDEIRFNIGATHYRLDHVRAAVSIIDHVTVEIPAVPEAYDVLTEKVREMKDMGVTFLNLHQIRCTPYNYKHLLDRKYTFLHGPAITVLESELTALRLLHYVIAENIGLPVNYCSLVYRNRFQTTGGRRRAAVRIKRPYEDITAAGMIRSLSVRGNREAIGRQADRLRSRQDAEGLWHLDTTQERLYFSGEIRPMIDLDGLSLNVSYHVASLHPSVTYRNLYREIDLNERRNVVVERHPVCKDITLADEDIGRFDVHVLGADGKNDESGVRGATNVPRDNSKGRETSPDEWETICRSEFIPSGLAEYF
jgi:pyruvate formate-lyase activating enzyme-like uncharacterized protein